MEVAVGQAVTFGLALLTSKVELPLLPEALTVKVFALPAVVGVTLNPVNCPAVKLPEMPVIPAVPP